jgi:hypothetical protein
VDTGAEVVAGSRDDTARLGSVADVVVTVDSVGFCEEREEPFGQFSSEWGIWREHTP